MNKKINIRIFDNEGKIKPNTICASDFINLVTSIKNIISDLIPEESESLKQEISIVSILDESLGIDFQVPDNKVFDDAINSLMLGVEDGFNANHKKNITPIQTFIKKNSGAKFQISAENKTSRIVSNEDPIVTHESEPEIIHGYYLLGELINIGGKDEKDIPAKIKDSANNKIISCKVKDKNLAIDLAHNLYKKVGLYGIAELKENILNSFEIEEFFVKEALDEKGIFDNISSELQGDESIRNLLKQSDLSEYFKKVRS